MTSTSGFLISTVGLLTFALIPGITPEIPSLPTFALTSICGFLTVTSGFLISTGLIVGMLISGALIFASRFGLLKPGAIVLVALNLSRFLLSSIEALISPKSELIILTSSWLNLTFAFTEGIFTSGCFIFGMFISVSPGMIPLISSPLFSIIGSWTLTLTSTFFGSNNFTLFLFLLKLLLLLLSSFW